MTIIIANSSSKPSRRSAIHPVLRTAAQETGRMVAMIAGYGALLGLFALAAISVWSNLPTAVADSQLVPGLGAPDGPVKLRGSL